VFQVVKEAKAKGFSDVLFLDAVEHKYIEEVSSCNAFIVKGKVISTSPTLGTILPGITRKTIIELASDLGYQVIIILKTIIELDTLIYSSISKVLGSISDLGMQRR
ncbi:branched-chain-amino-acid aminotransferase chloroplastic-like, partial [Trifolium pratense]